MRYLNPAYQLMLVSQALSLPFVFFGESLTVKKKKKIQNNLLSTALAVKCDSAVEPWNLCLKSFLLMLISSVPLVFIIFIYENVFVGQKYKNAWCINCPSH